MGFYLNKVTSFSKRCLKLMFESRFFSMIKFGRKRSASEEYKPSEAMVASLSLEREEDGFVMVGETSDERSTVKRGDAKNMETPPSYERMWQSSTDSSSDQQTYQTPPPAQPCNTGQVAGNQNQPHQP